MPRHDDCAWGFPTPDQWPQDDDVVAVGADLAPDTLLYAYTHGMFPMHIDRKHETLGWFSPLRRGVIPLDGLRVTRSMRRSARNFNITSDMAFVDVMRYCAMTRTDGNWIDDDFIDSYSMLHAMGHANSVEVWNEDNQLVGGLYGVRIDGFFAGESMFHLETDASKVALMGLVDMLRADGVVLLDTQWCTEHLASLGCIEVPRDQYLGLLDNALA
jgi:leucyl/phenylalanyl-tRNA--protein transferase